MVYIRNKKVKGIDYAYLVQSVWDPKRNISRQHTIKYLGKASQVTIDDIPEEYRDDTKILAFVSAFSSYHEERKELISKIQQEIFVLLNNCNVKGLVDIYEKYSRLFGLSDFYDKLLKSVMYRIGDLWQKGQLDVATEHASTNTGISLIKIINERITARTRSQKYSSKYKAVICTPDGELHGLACNMIESLLLNNGLKVYNISTSIPTDEGTKYIHDVRPDIVLISVTLSENIRSAERLIQQIQTKYNNKLPIVVGGSAFNNRNHYLNSTSSAFLMKEASFDDIMKLVKASIK
ncbi:MAG TPA: cobalamin-dependent protein [Nitrososphaeraceae archaeon]|nr:cobalamin-dependent protein [Nitrososphaeraceae archaeon]